MSMNIETPPGWRADTAPTDVIEETDLRRRGRLQQTSGEFLLCRLLARSFERARFTCRCPADAPIPLGRASP